MIAFTNKINRVKLTSRRKFFKSLFVILSLPLSWLWNSAVNRSNEIHSKKVSISSDEISNGISFYDNFIILKENNRIKIFSSRCSHLGCRINKIENNELVCPCHGSIYNLNGQVIKGPAQNSLKMVKFKVERNRIDVYEG